MLVLFLIPFLMSHSLEFTFIAVSHCIDIFIELTIRASRSIEVICIYVKIGFFFSDVHYIEIWIKTHFPFFLHFSLFPPPKVWRNALQKYYPYTFSIFSF